MSAWTQLTEARIREWLARPLAERASGPAPDPALPLELQLWQEVTALDGAAAAGPPDAAWHQRQADERMVRLLVLLEQEGRPLAAAHDAEQRRAQRSGSQVPR